MQVGLGLIGQTIELCCVKNSGDNRSHSIIAQRNMHGQSEWHKRLENFYRAYNPSKLEDLEFIPRIVLFYKGVQEWEAWLCLKVRTNRLDARMPSVVEWE